MPIRSPQQLRTLATPARQEILDALEAAGPSSVSQLSDLLGRAVTSLYAHVQALERSGLIRVTEQRREGRHIASIYDAAARPNLLDYDGPAGRKPIIKIVSAALRLSQREFNRACTAGAPARGTARRIWGGRARGWLTTAELRELNQLLERAQTLLRNARPRRGTTAVSLGFILAPVESSNTPTRRPQPGSSRATARRKVSP